MMPGRPGFEGWAAARSQALGMQPGGCVQGGVAALQADKGRFLARTARVVIVGFVLVASIPSSMIQMAFFTESLIPEDGRDLRPGARLLAPAVPHPPQRAPAPGGAITP